MSIVVDDMHQVDGVDSGNGESRSAALGLETEETPLLPTERDKAFLKPQSSSL